MKNSERKLFDTIAVGAGDIEAAGLAVESANYRRMAAAETVRNGWHIPLRPQGGVSGVSQGRGHRGKRGKQCR